MTHRNRKLLDLAHEAPCMIQIACGGFHYKEGEIVACHSDMLEDGRGIGHKSHDCLAVPGCRHCHLIFTREHLGKVGYAEAHYKAMKRYEIWKWENEKIRLN